jgi:hypothetical protein
MSFASQAETIRTAQYRLIRHSKMNADFAYELYDHSSPEGETKNLAETKPEIVKELNALLDAKLK